MEKGKLCVVTGTRAEYGLLKSVILKAINSDEIELLLYVTGSHLSPEFGFTYKEIENDDIPIDRKIEMLLSTDTTTGIIKSMGVEMIGLADALTEDKPDMMLLLGDRYEILVAAITAMVCGIPIAHIHGGELTEGAIDDAIRHSITKMSYLHFPATEEYRRRIIQLGENPERVYNVGALGVENIKNMKLLPKEEIEKEIGFTFTKKTAVVTFHPETLENIPAKDQINTLLRALDQFQDVNVIFTKANADADGRVINKIIEEYVDKNYERCKCFASLGHLRYLSVLKYCDVVIGNSSSGIIEAPTFCVPTVNLGNRQKGRTRAQSVIDSKIEINAIVKSVQFALSNEFKRSIAKQVNPYEGRDTSEVIIQKIHEFIKENKDKKRMKKFYDMV